MKRLAILGLVVVGWPSGGLAKDIPIEIYWSGTEPSGVFLGVPGGFQPLVSQANSTVFRGRTSVTGDRPERKTITVRYGSYSHPFDFRAHRTLSRVTFSVNHQVQGSCTSTRVREATAPSDNLLDAVNRSVAAGELINIPEPNACDRNLRFTAVRARYLQNAKMAELSNGFFLINRDVEEQYRQAAGKRGVNIDLELAAYQARDQEYEARQLVVFRTAAQAVGNYELALETNELMASRIASDAVAAAIYRKQGITNAALASYEQRLEVSAAAEEQQDAADQENKEPR